MPPLTRKQLGTKIRQARLARELGLREAAELLQIDKGYYSRIESGQVPLGKHAKAVAKLYGLNGQELEAMAGAALPNFRPYLRAKFNLSDNEIADMEAAFKAVRAQRKPKRGRS